MKILFLFLFFSFSSFSQETDKPVKPPEDNVQPATPVEATTDKPAAQPDGNVQPSSPTEKPPVSINPMHDTRIGRGFIFKSDDSQFTFNIRARIQARYSQILVPADPAEDKNGFEIRRLRLVARGSLYGKEWTYYIQLGFSNLDTESRPIGVRDAQIFYNKWSNFRINMGQMKVPFNRQRWNSSSALQMVDRSIVNNELNLDRDAGIQIFSEDLFKMKKMFGYNLGVFHGNGRNTGLKTNGLLYVGKFTYSPFGGLIKKVYMDEEDDRLSESDITRDAKPRMAFSVGVGHNKNTDRAGSTVGSTYQFALFDYHHQEIDMIFKWAGFSFTTEYMRRVANTPYKEKELASSPGKLTREYSRSAHGYFVQVGYLFPSFYEISARFGEFKPIGETDPLLIYSREQGVGFSKYFDDHNLKLQADYFHITGTPAVKGENHQARIQMQVFY
jgi:phosphate-selective porin OprO and OprP